jgi:uncharacterized protein
MNWPCHFVLSHGAKTIFLAADCFQNVAKIRLHSRQVLGNSTTQHQPLNIMSEQHPKPGEFCWNELVTTNVPAAKKFYTSLLGWKTKPFGKGVDYTIIVHGKDGVGGMMKSPKPGCPAQWVPYVIVADVDGIVKKTRKLKGKIAMPPMDVPTVGRLAVLVDPQGAVFGIIKP